MSRGCPHISSPLAGWALACWLVWPALATAQPPENPPSDSAGPSVSGRARATLERVVAADLARHASAAALVADLPFEAAFVELRPDELVALLSRESLLAAPLAADDVLARLADPLLAVDQLRPDGVLTRLAGLDGGSLLRHDPPETKARLRAAYAADPLGWLDAVDPRRLLELVDDRIPAGGAPQPDPFWAFVFDARPTGADDRLVPPVFLQAGPATPGTPNITLPGQVAAVTQRLPPGRAYLHSLSMHLVVGEGFRAGLVDPVDGQGRRGEFYLPWMDRWEAIVTPRFEGFFRRLRDLGGRVDLFSLDVEDKSFGLPWLTSARVPHLKPTGQTLWDALRADPRWPELQARLRAAGIDDLEGIDAWYSRRDPRTIVWNAVMERRRAEYLHRAIVVPLRRYFPQARVSNYGNYHHAQTLPSGDCFRFTESSHGSGTVVGNRQSYPTYSGAVEVVTPTGALNPSPRTETRVAWLEVADDTLRVGLRGEVRGATIGQQAQVTSPLDPDGAPLATSRLPIAWRPLVGRDYRLAGQDDPRTVLFDLLGPSLPRLEVPNSTKGLVLRLWQSYPGFVGDVMIARSMVAASRVPILPWIEHPELKRERHGWTEGHPYYAETVFHLALNGADDFLYWVWSELPDPAAGNRRLAQVLTELDPLVGLTPRRTLSFGPVSWDDPYLLTGMEAGGRRIWRWTPRAGRSWELVSRQPVRITIGDLDLELPESELYEPAEPASNLGLWIIQTRGSQRLTRPAAEVWEAIWGGTRGGAGT